MMVIPLEGVACKAGVSAKTDMLQATNNNFNT